MQIKICTKYRDMGNLRSSVPDKSAEAWVASNGVFCTNLIFMASTFFCGRGGNLKFGDRKLPFIIVILTRKQLLKTQLNFPESFACPDIQLCMP